MFDSTNVLWYSFAISHISSVGTSTPSIRVRTQLLLRKNILFSQFSGTHSQSKSALGKRGKTDVDKVLSEVIGTKASTLSTNEINKSEIAGIDLSEIKYVNAHATSTPIGDLNEAKAIAKVFGEHKPYVASTKSFTGHEMWMAGASEIVYSMLMMQNNFIAANLNFEEPDEASANINIPTERVDIEFDTFLSNSFGFGGTNSTLIIKKFK